ncbi:MazG nucleotide pyrophosphohydrolase domain-containing protein [Burkholderia contaminans]|uniref:MazG nucleotide pyrophosphohydrolase domain-containing protein n=1 Tax=Burkholderia contaminans TaxID=488447 RepID=UPI001CF4C130|nr:MazG nucleotide pyrophosphohydrolase domain-containing protein [Burkholderia contaminans]MCA8096756.1 hypothetical protein [Burkholderia contaminans]
MSSLQLAKNPQLKDFQSYVRDLEIERGFSEQDAIQKCLLLGEEMGELFKAVRKHQAMGIDQNSKIGSVKEELADIFIYICAIANRFNIDLESAFLEKEAFNKTRVWRS